MPKADIKRDDNNAMVEELMDQLTAIKQNVAAQEKLREGLQRINANI